MPYSLRLPELLEVHRYRGNTSTFPPFRDILSCIPPFPCDCFFDWQKRCVCVSCGNDAVRYRSIKTSFLFFSCVCKNFHFLEEKQTLLLLSSGLALQYSLSQLMSKIPLCSLLAACVRHYSGKTLPEKTGCLLENENFYLGNYTVPIGYDLVRSFVS